MAKFGTCNECKLPNRQLNHWNVCRECHRKVCIRREPTAKEVEEMVAQQLANKPAWWDNSHENAHHHQGPRGSVKPQDIYEPPVRRKEPVRIKGRTRKRLAE